MIKAIIEIYGHAEGLTIENGIIKEWPYAAPQPTEQELEDLIALEIKIKALDKAEELYRELKKLVYVSVDSVVYDLESYSDFERQRKNSPNIRLKPAKGKTIYKTKAETDAIETALVQYKTSAADAFDADMDLINDPVSPDYSLPNMTALKNSQLALVN